MEGSMILLSVIEGIICVVGITANSLLFYLMRKQEGQRKREQMGRSFNRVIKKVFIHSLAYSNLVSCVFSVPISIVGHFYDIYVNDSICKVIRWFNYNFATVTVANIVVLGIERYLSVFHPLRVPTKTTVRKLLVAAWAFGLIFALLPTLASSSQLATINDAPKHVCRINSSNVAHITLVAVYSFVGYIVPCVVMAYINVCIIRFLRRRKRETRSTASLAPLVTNASVTVLVVLIAPYFMAFVFLLLRMLIKIQFTYESDVIFRRSVAIIAYSNAVINPVFMIYKIPRFKKQFQAIFRKEISSENEQHGLGKSNIGTSIQQRCVLDVVLERPQKKVTHGLVLISVKSLEDNDEAAYKYAESSRARGEEKTRRLDSNGKQLD